MRAGSKPLKKDRAREFENRKQSARTRVENLRTRSKPFESDYVENLRTGSKKLERD